MSIFISILLSMINIYIAVAIIINTKDGKMFDSMLEFVNGLFENRNIFGIFVSLFICILLVPSFTFILNILIIRWLLNILKFISNNLLPFIGKFFCHIWELGNKK